MILKLFALIGFYTLPIWGIIFCLNLISIIEKIKYEKEHKKSTFWFTLSFVIIITVLSLLSIEIRWIKSKIIITMFLKPTVAIAIQGKSLFILTWLVIKGMLLIEIGYLEYFGLRGSIVYSLLFFLVLIALIVLIVLKRQNKKVVIILTIILIVFLVGGLMFIRDVVQNFAP